MKYLLVNDEYDQGERWVLSVETYEQLIEWHTTSGHTSAGAHDIYQGLLKTGKHAVSTVGIWYEMLMELGLASGKELGYNSYAKLANEVLLDSKREALDDGKHVIINPNGSYATLCGDFFYIIDEMESDTWPVLTGKARYIQWANGKHWYAKIGDLDVVVDGDQKWDSKKEAEKAVAKYMKVIYNTDNITA